jgi:hypothetical protein
MSTAPPFNPDADRWLEERITDGQQTRAEARAAALGGHLDCTRQGWRLCIGSRVGVFEAWDHVVRALEIAESDEYHARRAAASNQANTNPHHAIPHTDR